MRAIVNVGMIRNTGEGMLHQNNIFSVLQSEGLNVHKYRIVWADHAHGGEDTFIAQVSADDQLYEKVYAASKWLDQDCIAVYDLDLCNGALVGPNAGKWGLFNPDYFKVV